MGTSLTLGPVVRNAFTGLIDYAGLFPPAKLELAQAADEYRSAAGGPQSWMLGRFIIPLSLLASSRGTIDAPLSVILGIGEDIEKVSMLRSAGVRIEMLEAPLPPADCHPNTIVTALERLRQSLDHAQLGDVPAFVELARNARWTELLSEAMPAMARLGLRAKLRCGGLSAEAFPSVDDVAAFIGAACASGVPFKATAGLHHPVRHRDEATGFTMHGFLNLLVASALARHVVRETLRQAIAEEDPAAFSFESTALHWRDRRVGAADLAQMRRDGLVSYGSCSFAEPVADLVSLGVLRA
jgi:hypothetical protein